MAGFDGYITEVRAPIKLTLKPGESFRLYHRTVANINGEELLGEPRDVQDLVRIYCKKAKITIDNPAPVAPRSEVAKPAVLKAKYKHANKAKDQEEEPTVV